MVPPSFDRARIEQLLAFFADRLDGEWLLIGGGAAAAWFSPSRTTEDLDLVGLLGSQDERMALMELASEAAVPIEAVNSAGAFFLRQIEGWRDEMVLLRRGTRATIYRPSATLFLLLKIERLTATDLEDCLALIDHCKISLERFDADRVRARIGELASTDDIALSERRQLLSTRL